MNRDAELLTGDPRWYNFLPGTSPLNFIFTGVDAAGALRRDVLCFDLCLLMLSSVEDMKLDLVCSIIWYCGRF